MKDSNCQDSENLLDDQYKNSSNLGDRAQLHNHYSSNSIGWFPWIYSFLNLQSGDKVLECGAGPGWLWQENLDRLPEDCHITVTDFSSGMVDEAKKALEPSGFNFKFQIADVQDLRFADNSFDVVIANHMLYHVPQFEKAMRELSRVMKPNAVFIASTVGKGHMKEMHQFAIQAVPELEKIFETYQPNFSLENGREKLNPWFSAVEIFNYDNELQVTEVEPVAAYIYSSSIVRDLFDSHKKQLLNQMIEKIIIEKGYFPVSTNSGLFKAKHS